MKKLAKRQITKLLWRQVAKLRAQNDIKVVAVVGSIGKTSTKYAIARVLKESQRVRFQQGNYNDIVSVPLVFFDMLLPSLFSPTAWAKTLKQIKQQVKKPYQYDVVVLELGTDGPGQINEFARYLKCDIAVVTAITPEHMEYFENMAQVAEEELSVATFSNTVVVNADLCSSAYLKKLSNPPVTYGTDSNDDYMLKIGKFTSSRADFAVRKAGKPFVPATMEAVSVAELYSATAAIVVSDLLGAAPSKIITGIAKLKPVSGRMQRLKGINNSTIIDETYNASPTAVKAALDSLYTIKAPQKIAILGNMNELGHMSQQAHKEVGKYCEPKQLDFVVTIGPDANKYLADAAKRNGCRVYTFTDPYKAGEFVKERVEKGAVILAKGSQNGVFAEEALKALLLNPADNKLLVRQSPDWLERKFKNLGARE